MEQYFSKLEEDFIPAVEKSVERGAYKEYHILYIPGCLSGREDFLRSKMLFSCSIVCHVWLGSWSDGGSG